MRKEVKPIGVSEEDRDLLTESRWFVGKVGYAVRNVKGKRQEYLHRIVAARMGLELSKTRCVDHIDRDKLNNRRDNLRSCSRTENQWNNASPGIGWEEARKKWRARLNKNGKQIWFARFDSREDAIAARKQKQKEHYGEFAPCEER